tara:strand:+ start:9194 stop:10798 length:1605 start_codon:yes stop_codon:yes gene_type:complete
MALANKYRPKSFSEVIGQDNAVVALRNIIKNQNFHNGYIFSGTRGVGKTTLGRLFAKALNCSNYDLEKGETCNVCANCEAIQNNSHLDLIEIDAASRTGVDDMRELLDSVQYRPSQGKYKVYLIDEVHMLSMQSFNALLKTLEEPPNHVIFIMATTETHKIPKTIISRCLQFNLKLVSDELIKENIKKVFKEENVKSDEKSLDLLVELAKGSVRDSLTLSDQAISHCDGNLDEESISKLHGVLDLSSTTKLFDSIFKNEADKVVEELKRYQSLDVNYEILFDRALSFLHQKIIEMALSHETSSQSLNLYYQFFSNGLVDAKQTGKTRDCFDIAVLRCLTFINSDSTEVKKKSKLVEKIKPTPVEKPAKTEEPKAIEEPLIQKQEEDKEILSPKKDTNKTESLKNLTPTNWLNVFDLLDLTGPSRAFFSNLQIEKVEENTIFFKGADMFADRINNENIQSLIDSLVRLGFEEYQVEIESSDSAKNTPSSKWAKKRAEEIKIFKEEIISSDLLVKLKNDFGENIDASKITVIDHEE